MDSENLLCFQHLWTIMTGKSSTSTKKVKVKKAIEKFKSVSNGLSYYKAFSKTSADKFAKNKKVSEAIRKFTNRCAKLLNLDSVQCYGVLLQHRDQFHHCCDITIQNMVEDERESRVLMENVISLYFIERLFLLRSYMPVITSSQDKTHPLQSEYKNFLEGKLLNLNKTLQQQLESSMKEEIVSMQNRGEDCHPDVAEFILVQRLKEQCVILEVLVLYYSQFSMKPEILLEFTKSFAKCGFGRNHPILVSNLDVSIFEPHLSVLNCLQQVLLIEGIDMEFLQETDASKHHQLAKSKKVMDEINQIVTSQLTSDPHLSPVTLTWATVRYILMEDNGGDETVKLGERAIEMNIWKKITNMMNLHPFNIDSEVSKCGRKALKSLVNCVTNLFHESTLGNYLELVSCVASLHISNNSKNANNGDCFTNQLLTSAVSLIPIHLESMLHLLPLMLSDVSSVKQVNAFVSSLPIVCEFSTSCFREEVEISPQDENCYTLVSDKILNCFNGKMQVLIPEGTVGYVQENFLGSMVQWRVQIDGWEIINQQLQCIVEYNGASSDLELLGNTQNCTLVMKLLQDMLNIISSSSEFLQDTACLAVLDVLKPIINTTFLAINKLLSNHEPPMQLVASMVDCVTSWMKCGQHCDVIKILCDSRYFPYYEMFSSVVGQLHGDLNPALFGTVVNKIEKMLGCYHVTNSTIKLITAAVNMTSQLKMTSQTEESLECCVEFVLCEIFSSFVDWLKTDAESWNEIGLNCLELCHAILGKHKLSNMLVKILINTQCADVLIKLSIIPSSYLLNLISNEPHSQRTTNVRRIVTLTFSILNNLLRNDDLVNNQCRLKSLLTYTPSRVPTEDNLVYILHAYFYIEQFSTLPRLAITLLRRISIISPMSLCSVLGANAKTFRNILWKRLQQVTNENDDSFKLAILQLLVVWVQTQPALLELTLDLQPVDGTNNIKPSTNYKLGEKSCLQVVIQIISDGKLNIEMHTVCVELLNSLWVDRRLSATKAIQNKSGEKFWSSLMLPLFSENTPKNMATNNILGTCAHVINIVALENLYKSPTNDKSDPLNKVIKKFTDEKRFQHWSKVMLCVCKLVCRSNEMVEDRLMFISAFRSFVATFNQHISANENVASSIIDDLLTSIEFIFKSEKQETKEVVKILDLTSSVLFILSSKFLEKHTNHKNNKEFLSRLVACLEMIPFSQIQSTNEGSVFVNEHINNLYATSYKFVLTPGVCCSEETSLKLAKSSCSLLHLVFNSNHIPFASNIAEAGMTAMKLIENIYLKASSSNLITLLSTQSVVNLLLMVLVKLVTNKFAPENDELHLKLSTTICWFLHNLLATNSDVSTAVAIHIKKSPHLQQLFLNLSLCYTNNLKSNPEKWCEVYHVILLITTQMIICLRHDYKAEAIDFVGVHHKRFLECMRALDYATVKSAVLTSQQTDNAPSVTSQRGKVILRELQITTRLVQVTVAAYSSSTNQMPLFRELTNHVLVACHASLAFLIHPITFNKNYFDKSKIGTKMNLSPVKSNQRSFSREKSVSFSMENEENEGEVEVSDYQRRLVNILANCLIFMYNLSPNFIDVCNDQIDDIDAYPRLVAINFTTPSVQDGGLPTFGTLLNAATFAYGLARKKKSRDTYTETLEVVGDMSMLLCMSQGLTYLKSHQVPINVKQLLKRELVDEMTSCAKAELKRQRFYQSAKTPIKTPLSTISNNQTQPSHTMPELLNQFVKHLTSSN